MNFNQWWEGTDWDIQEFEDIESLTRSAWDASEKRAKVWQWVCLIIVWAMVAFEVFQFIALVEHRNHTGVWAPADTAYPNIAIDTTAPHTPHVFINHKYGMKNRTMGVYLP